MTNTNTAHKLNGGTPHTLEQRVAAALSDAGIGASALAELVVETEKGIADATTIAARMQEIALDPLQSRDAAEAQAAAQLAELVVRRLENVIPRLRSKHQQVAAQERRARWNQAADVVQGERDAMAQEFKEKYPALINQLVSLFERLRVTDANVDRINGAAPSVESRRASPLGHQRLLGATKLFNLTGEPLWPPAQAQILPEQVMQVPPHPGANWASAIDQRDRARHAESQRVANYHAQQAKAREDQENAAARAARERGS